VDSGKTAAILSIAVTGFVQCYVDIYENITVTSYGTPITIRNLNLNSTNTNICKIYYGGTYDHQKYRYNPLVNNQHFFKFHNLCPL